MLQVVDFPPTLFFLLGLLFTHLIAIFFSRSFSLPLPSWVQFFSFLFLCKIDGGNYLRVRVSRFDDFANIEVYIIRGVSHEEVQNLKISLTFDFTQKC